MTPPRRTQTRGAEKSSAGSSLGSWRLELCLGRKETGTSKVVEQFLIIESTEMSSFCKNSLGNTIGVPKTALVGERPLPSLGCALSPMSTKGELLRPCCRGDACAKRILEVLVQSFDCFVRLRMICFCLSKRDVKHLAKFKPKVRSKLWPTIQNDCFGHTKT
jgi:hypothetical protein